MKPLIFAAVLAAGLGLQVWTIVRFVRFMLVGRPDIKLDRLPERFLSVLVYWLMQKKVPEKTMDHPKSGFTSKHHLMIFWGFLIITVGTVEMWVNGLFGFDFSFIGSALYAPLVWAIDVMNLLVLF